MNRWWTYQRERFPVVAWTAFITAASLGVLAFSARSRGADAPSLHAFVVAFLCTILVFLELRIADEFKDFEDDARDRPYRPVPRGLVRLSELRGIGVVAIVVQVAVAASLDVRLLTPLGVVLGYFALMTREFLAPRWLRAHPRIYLFSHQLILPLIYFFISACDWLPARAVPPAGLGWVLAMSYASGHVVELGRKIRAPADEEKGVETYSVLWGRGPAVGAWLCSALFSGATAFAAARMIGFGRVVAVVGVVLFGLMLAAAARFLRQPVAGAGKQIDAVSGLWTIGIHVALAGSLLISR